MSVRPGRRRWLLPVILAAIAGLVIVAIATSSMSGTGAIDVGSVGGDESTAAPTGEGQSGTVDCKPTESNPGGTNNYIPDAPEGEPLGEGLTISGTVRAAPTCQPLEGIRVQVWLATEAGSEAENQTSVRTGPDGRYEVQTAPVVNQFGEPNIHVAYADAEYRDVFIRRVIDVDDTEAVVDLILAPDG